MVPFGWPVAVSRREKKSVIITAEKTDSGETEVYGAVLQKKIFFFFSKLHHKPLSNILSAYF